MFRCGVCFKSSEPREKAVTVVTATRTKEYPPLFQAHKFISREGTPIIKDDPGGIGWEIAKEVPAHAQCADDFALFSPPVKVPQPKPIITEPPVRTHYDFSKGTRAKYTK